jgi:hypothetical protein
VRVSILKDRDIPESRAPGERTEQTLNMQGAFISGDVVLANRSSLASSKDEKGLGQRRALIKIGRLFEDFTGYLSHTLEQHRKEIDQIAQQHVFTNSYQGGSHLKAQYALAREKRQEIAKKWLEAKREVEDVLLQSDQVMDEQARQRYNDAENSQKQAQEEVLALTHGYFTSRSSTFHGPNLEDLKQRVIDNKAI